MYVCMYVCMYACKYVCIYACNVKYVCMYVTHACMYVCMSVCLCAGMYVCRYVLIDSLLRRLNHIEFNTQRAQHECSRVGFELSLALHFEYDRNHTLTFNITLYTFAWQRCFLTSFCFSCHLRISTNARRGWLINCLGGRVNDLLSGSLRAIFNDSLNGWLNGWLKARHKCWSVFDWGFLSLWLIASLGDLQSG